MNSEGLGYFVKTSAGPPVLVELLDPGSLPVPGGDVGAIDFPLGLVTASSAAVIPAGALVLRALVTVVTPYSPGATIKLGRAGALALVQATSDNDAEVAGQYDAPQRTAWGVLAAVVATVVGAPAAGSAFVTIEYAQAAP